MMLEHLRRMAHYNAWANSRLYDACAQLPETEYRKPRRAFFGSIHGTLNHLLVVDWSWLARIEGKGSPQVRLDDQPCASLEELREARDVEDARMIRLVDGYSEDDPGQVRALSSDHPAGGGRDPTGRLLGPPLQPPDPPPPPPLGLILHLREAGGTR